MSPRGKAMCHLRLSINYNDIVVFTIFIEITWEATEWPKMSRRPCLLPV